MFKVLLLISLVIAIFFIVNSAFRRRLIWSIRVTLGFYAVMLVIRMILWAAWVFFEPGTDEWDTFSAIMAISLVCAVVWVGSRYLTERHLRRLRLSTGTRRSIPRRSRPGKSE